MKHFESIADCMTYMQNEAQKVRRELKSMPKGCLLIQMKGQKPEYLKVSYNNDGTRKRIYLNSDMQQVYKLAHKAYLEEKLKRLEYNAVLLAKVSSKWMSPEDADVLKELPKHSELLEPRAVINPSFTPELEFRPQPVNDGSVEPVDALLSIGSTDIGEWAVKPYCTNTKFEENKIHRSSNGVSCRSKGEVALIELCNMLGYLYHYDETVRVGGRLRSPDLIIARRDGSLVYVEHRGWRGEEYERANFEKDRLYFNAGIRQGLNYLITFESDDGGINVELVKMQLRSIVEDL